MPENTTRLDVSPVQGDRHLALAGEVDAFTAGQLTSTLEALGTDEDVVLDMGGVTFMDSSGLRALISAHQALEAAGTRLELHSPSAPVVRLLEIVGLTDHLNIVT